MSTTNEDGKQPENVEATKEQASAGCGPGCGCGTALKPNKARWVVGVVVLAAAGVLVVKGMIKNGDGWTQAARSGFVNAAATEVAEASADVKPADAVATDETSVGATLGAFSELNQVALKTDAAFIYLPAKEGPPGKAPGARMRAAAQIMEGQGIKCGLFTLKPGCADYEQIAKQMAVPGVVALVKGRGMSAISGEVTEVKLLQGCMAASQAGACGPGASPNCCSK